MINLKVGAFQHWSCKLHRFGKMLRKKNMPQFQESVNYKMMQKAVKVKHVHTMQVIDFQLDCFNGSVHKLSYKLKFIVSYEWSVVVISQSLFITKLRPQTGAVFMLPIHRYFRAAANLYPVKNQPGVNVSGEGLILCCSSCGIRALKASWDVRPGVKNVLDPWDKAKLETYVQQNIRLTNIECFPAALWILLLFPIRFLWWNGLKLSG